MAQYKGQFESCCEGLVCCYTALCQTHNLCEKYFRKLCRDIHFDFVDFADDLPVGRFCFCLLCCIHAHRKVWHLDIQSLVPNSVEFSCNFLRKSKREQTINRDEPLQVWKEFDLIVTDRVTNRRPDLKTKIYNISKWIVHVSFNKLPFHYDVTSWCKHDDWNR